MNPKTLFEKTDELLHGGDYNPEQWLDRPDILEEDIRLMKQAGVNVVTLGVFSWSVYEPSEGEFHFDWLESILDNLYRNGIFTILATPSGARPAWLDEKYPEAMRVSPAGVRNHHGIRHNHCMSSPKYREKAGVMLQKLAEKFGKHPGLLLWHISNELGGECYCELCRDRFREFLRNKYQDKIDNLNQEWWTTFWSHRFNRFDQIEPPYANGESSIHGLNLDWKRFNTWNMTDYMKFEIELLRKFTPDIPVTTNFMRLYKTLDYSVMARELDLISWDSYPEWENDYEAAVKTANAVSFDHSLLRSFKKDKPFLLMESVPSLVNWHPYNKLKRPGTHKLSCIQAVACGSDMVGYFQWRKGRGSYEQYHGAVMDHLGRSDTRVFKEVEEVGGLLKRLKPVAGSIVNPRAALIFDWNNRWAIEDMAGLSKDKKYEETCRTLYGIFIKNGIEMDVISSDADFTDYKVLVAPMLYLLKPGVAGRLKEFTANGGILMATYLTGYVNENTLCWLGGFPGDGLTELFGLYTEEIDTLYPKDTNAVSFRQDFIDADYRAFDYCEIIKPQTARILGEYTRDFYCGTPAVTVNAYGKGYAYYVGARIEESGMEALFQKLWEQAGIKAVPLPEGVEYHSRSGSEGAFEFYLNFSDKIQTLTEVKPGRNLITGETVAEMLTLAPFDVAVIQSKLPTTSSTI